MRHPTPPDPKRATDAERTAVLRVIGVWWTSHPRLAAESGLSMRRAQLAVTDLVLDGVPILSGPKGFRRSMEPAEMDDAAERLRHRAREILRRSSALRRTAERLRSEIEGRRPEEQIPLDIGSPQA